MCLYVCHCVFISNDHTSNDRPGDQCHLICPVGMRHVGGYKYIVRRGAGIAQWSARGLFLGHLSPDRGSNLPKMPNITFRTPLQYAKKLSFGCAPRAFPRGPYQKQTNPNPRDKRGPHEETCNLLDQQRLVLINEPKQKSEGEGGLPRKNF